MPPTQNARTHVHTAYVRMPPGRRSSEGRQGGGWKRCPNRGGRTWRGRGVSSRPRGLGQNRASPSPQRFAPPGPASPQSNPSPPPRGLAVPDRPAAKSAAEALPSPRPGPSRSSRSPSSTAPHGHPRPRRAPGRPPPPPSPARAAVSPSYLPKPTNVCRVMRGEPPPTHTGSCAARGVAFGPTPASVSYGKCDLFLGFRPERNQWPVLTTKPVKARASRGFFGRQIRIFRFWSSPPWKIWGVFFLQYWIPPPPGGKGGRMGLLDHLPRGVSLGFPGLATFLGFWGWKFLGLFSA